MKYEDVYIKDYERVPDLEAGLAAYFRFYDEERPHQSLGYRTPGEVYRAGLNPARFRRGTITNPGPRAVQFPGTTSGRSSGPESTSMGSQCRPKLTYFRGHTRWERTNVAM